MVIAAETASSCPSIGDRQACIFCMDSLSPICETLSNLADSYAKRPVPLICDTRVPGWISDDTEVIVVTDKADGPIGTLFDELADRGCRIHCITGNTEIADNDDRITGHSILLEGNEMERSAETLGALCGLLTEVKGLVPITRLNVARESISPEMMAEEAERITAVIKGRRLAVYSPTYTHASASFWKDSVIERTGLPAFSGELPEFDHNELVGWSDPNEHAPELLMIVLKGDNDGSIPSTIVNLMSEVLTENGRETLTVPIGGGDIFEQNLRGILLGWTVSDMIRRSE